MVSDVAEREKENVIPNNWNITTIGESVDINLGQSPPGESYNDEGEGMPFMQGNAQFGYKYPEDHRYTTDPKKISEKGSILFSVRAPVGAINIADKEYCIGRGLTALDAKNGNNKFLYYLLRHYSLEIKKDATGSTFKAISKTNLSKFRIAYPSEIEQRKIASILTTVQNAIEQTEAVIQATRELKKSMMKHLFTYGAVPVDKTEQVELKETELASIPDSWELIKVEDIFDFSRKPRNLDINEGDLIPFLPMKNISEMWNEVDSYEVKKWNEISSGSYVEKDDLIVAKITPSFENGKQAILNDLPNEFGYATTEIWALHPKENEKVMSEFLFYYLEKDNVRESIAQKMEGSTGRQRVPKSVLANLLIPLPDFDTQKKIIGYLFNLDNKINQECDKVGSLKALFNSLLENLMTAKIRVN